MLLTQTQDSTQGPPGSTYSGMGAGLWMGVPNILFQISKCFCPSIGKGGRLVSGLAGAEEGREKQGGGRTCFYPNGKANPFPHPTPIENDIDWQRSKGPPPPPRAKHGEVMFGLGAVCSWQGGTEARKHVCAQPGHPAARCQPAHCHAATPVPLARLPGSCGAGTSWHP